MTLTFPIILDGATGTQLQKKGMPGGACTEKWVLENPAAIKEVQTEYIKNGSDVIYAPTFGANGIKLAENGITNVADYNTRLAAISREVADTVLKADGTKVLVAGDIAPTGKFLPPMGDLPFEKMVEVYKEQVAALDKAGVDLFVVETMMTVPDARAAVTAIHEVCDKPIFVTFTCNEKGKTLTGSDITAVLVTLQSMGVNAFGMNCSVGPDQMVIQAKRLSEYADIPLIAKPNAGLPEMVDGVALYNCPPDEFTEFTKEFAEAGVKVFGGCCGTTEEHIYELKRVITAMDDTSGVFAAQNRARVSDGMVLLTTEKEVFEIDAALEIDEEDILSCEDPDDFEDDLYDEEDKDLPVTAVRITSEEEIDIFAEAAYAIKKPVCFFCEDADILEKVLRANQGRAMYRGELDSDVLEPLSVKYGLVY